MTKIKEILTSKDKILVFDVDGVLAKMEYGDYTHYALDDDAWKLMIMESKTNPYMKVSPVKCMQDFIKKQDINRVYVVSKVMNEKELEYKKEFLNKYYNIIPSHVFMVYDDLDKVKVLDSIYKDYEVLPKYLVMIDDSVTVLNEVMAKSKFSTIHISSFLE